MKFFTFLLVTLVVAFLANKVDHEALVHLAAHFGSSFTLQTLFYGINKRQYSLRYSKITALLDALVVGLIYKCFEHAGVSEICISMGENLSGCLFAVFVQNEYDL